MNTMKIGWGTKIALMYIGFVGLIITLITMSMRQDFQLVAPDYYQQELKYQEVIDASRNQAALSAPAKIVAGEETITVSFPSEFKDEILKGTVSFYAPANAEWDQEFKLETTDNRMVISRKNLRDTRYKIKLSWQAGGKDYYQESVLNLYNK